MGNWSSITMSILGESVEWPKVILPKRPGNLELTEIGGRGHSFSGTLSLPNSRQRVSWWQREPSGRHCTSRWMTWVQENGERGGDLATPQYRPIYCIHPPLHPFILAWTSMEEKDKPCIFLSHHYLVSVNTSISINKNSVKLPACKLLSANY